MGEIDDDAEAESLDQAVRLLLAEHGALPVTEIIGRLDPSLLDYLRDEGFVDDELADVLVEEVLMADDIWATPDDRLALTGPILDGTVFTHRVTQDELDRGEVRSFPDLDLLDWDEPDGLECAGGALERVSGPRVAGQDTSGFAGPKGWLDGFVTGDLLAFRLRAGTVSVEAVREDALGDGASVVAALRAASERRIPAGAGEEIYPVLLDTLIDDPSAFRAPVRPVGELMVAAGFVNQGFAWGRADEEWLPHWQIAAGARRDEIAARFEFDDCCLDAFDVVCAAFDAFEADGALVDAAGVAEALLHGDVAEAFVEGELGGFAGAVADTIVRFPDAVAAGVPPRASAGALVVSALVQERLGNALAAEAALRAARVADPSFGPAAWHLVDYEIDRSALGAALALLHHPDVPVDEESIALLERYKRDLGAAHRGVGRNDPCPCGSGRKFKQCCQDAPAPLSSRAPLVSHKLARYALRPDIRPRVVGLASSAVDLDDDEPVTQLRSLAEDPFFTDLALFEDGLADDYLEARGDLLPADERELIAALVDSPRRLCEITAVDPGASLALRDTRTGETFDVTERAGSRNAQVGEYRLLRIAPVGATHQIFGVPLDIPLRLRESVMELLDADPPANADDFAGWYGWSRRPPTLTNTEGEPFVACDVQFGTTVSLADLHAVLDGVFERHGDGEWSDIWHNDAGDPIVRGTIRFGDGTLHVDANSDVRADRIVVALHTALPGLEPLRDERRDQRALRRDTPASSAAEEVSTSSLEFLDARVREMETRWLDESIPALGGLTPRQAADDPTRREDLLALLREFDARPVPGPNAATFDTMRIRRALGLDDHA